MTEIKIPYSRMKIGFVFLGAMSFVLIGILTVLSEDGLTSTMYRSEYFNKFFGLLAIVFFGLIAFITPTFLIRNYPAIIINDKGIIDKSNLSSIGLIEWSDITGIRTKKVQSTSFLLIDTSDAEKYIGKAKTNFKRNLLKANNRVYATPLSISTPVLGIKFKDLEKIVLTAYKKNI